MSACLEGFFLHHANYILQVVCKSVVCQTPQAVAHASQRPFRLARKKRAVPVTPKSSMRRPWQLRETRVDKAAAATLAVILEKHRQIPLPSLHPMAVRRTTAASRPRFSRTAQPTPRGCPGGGTRRTRQVQRQ